MDDKEFLELHNNVTSFSRGEKPAFAESSVDLPRLEDVENYVPADNAAQNNVVPEINKEQLSADVDKAVDKYFNTDGVNELPNDNEAQEIAESVQPETSVWDDIDRSDTMKAIRRTNAYKTYMYNNEDVIAEARKISKATNVAENIILSSPETLNNMRDVYKAYEKEKDMDKVYERYPGLKGLAEKDESAAALAISNLEDVKVAHGIIDNVVAGAKKYWLSFQRNMIGADAFYGKGLSAENLDKIKTLDKQLKEAKEVPDFFDAPIDNALGTTVEQVAMMANQYARGGWMGVLGAGVGYVGTKTIGAAAGTVTGTGPIALAATEQLARQNAMRGMGIGMRIGGGKAMFDELAGQYYLQALEYKNKAGGQQFTEDEARLMAGLQAGVETMIELGTTESVLKILGKNPSTAPAKEILQNLLKGAKDKESAIALLKTEGVNIIRKTFKVGKEEAIEEGKQQLSTDLIGNVFAAYVAPDGHEKYGLNVLGPQELFARATEATVQAAVPSFTVGLAGAGGSSVRAVRSFMGNMQLKEALNEVGLDYNNWAKNTNGVQMLRDLKEKFANTKFAKEHPEEAEALLKETLKDSGYENVTVDTELFKKEEGGSEILYQLASAAGMTEEQAQAAIDSNENITVPTDVYAKSVKDNPIADKLLDKISFDKEGDCLERCRKYAASLKHAWDKMIDAESTRKMEAAYNVLKDTIGEEDAMNAMGIVELYPENPEAGAKKKAQEQQQEIDRLLKPVLEVMNQNIHQGVTEYYNNRETGEYQNPEDVADLFGKEETASSGSYERVRASNNAQWYQNFVKAHGRIPTQTEMRQIAEDVFSGKNEYGVPGWEVTDVETEEAAEANARMLENLKADKAMYERLSEKLKNFDTGKIAAAEGLTESGYAAYKYLVDNINGAEMNKATQRSVAAGAMLWAHVAERYAEAYQAMGQDVTALDVIKRFKFSSKDQGEGFNELSASDIGYGYGETNQFKEPWREASKTEDLQKILKPILAKPVALKDGTLVNVSYSRVEKFARYKSQNAYTLFANIDSIINAADKKLHLNRDQLSENEKRHFKSIAYYEKDFRDYHIEFQVRRDFNDKLSVYFDSVTGPENGIKKEDVTPVTEADKNQVPSAITTSKDSIPQSGLLDNMVGSEKLNKLLQDSIFSSTARDQDGKLAHSIDDIIKMLDAAAMELGAKPKYKDQEGHYKDYKDSHYYILNDITLRFSNHPPKYFDWDVNFTIDEDSIVKHLANIKTHEDLVKFVEGLYNRQNTNYTRVAPNQQKIKNQQYAMLSGIIDIELENIHTPEEVFSRDVFEKYSDFQYDRARKAIATGKLVVYTTGPIRPGMKVYPSKKLFKAENKNQKEYRCELNVDDAAWLDSQHGLYAPVEESVVLRQTVSKEASVAERNFKAWLGNSKVVDADGNPKVMYHGTGTEGITEFKHSKAQDKMGRSMAMGQGKGKFYFATTEGAANIAAQGAVYRGQGKNAQVMPVYLRIENPVNLDTYKQRYQEISGHDLNEGYSDGYTMKDRDKYIAKLDKQLKKEGIDGIYDEGYGFAAVFEPTQIKSAVKNNGNYDINNPNIFMQQDGLFQNKQGFIEFQQQGQYVVHLLENADESTFMHEMSHGFYDMLKQMAETENAPDQIKKDYETLRKWTEYNPEQINEYKGAATYTEFAELDRLIREAAEKGSAKTVDVDGNEHFESYQSLLNRWRQERFARGFEEYLRQGKAPTEGMKGIFSKFKNWLVKIYKGCVGVGAKPTEAVKEVMDRMIASKEEIDLAMKRAEILKWKEAGAAELLTKTSKEYYDNLLEKAREEAEEKVLKLAMKDLDAEEKAKYQEKLDKEREAATERIKQKPVFMIQQHMEQNTGLDIESVAKLLGNMTEAEYKQQLKLEGGSVEKAVDRYMEAYKNELDDSVKPGGEQYQAKLRAAAEEAVITSKYTDLIAAYELQAYKKAVQRIRRLEKRLADIEATDEAERKQAEAAVRKEEKARNEQEDRDTRVQDLRRELKGMKESIRAYGKNSQDEITQARYYANNRLDTLPVGEATDFRKWGNLAVRKHQEAMDMLNAGKLEEATKLQKEVLVYRMLEKRAYELNQKYEKKVTRMAARSRTIAREHSMDANDTYLYNHLLYIFGLTDKDAPRPADFPGVQEQLILSADGVADENTPQSSWIQPDDWLMNAITGEVPMENGLDSLTMEQFREVEELMQYVYFTGKDRNSVKTLTDTEGNSITIEELNVSIAVEAGEKRGVRDTRKNVGGDSALESAMRAARKHKVELIKPETILNAMGESAMKYLYNPLRKCADKELTMNQELVSKQQAVFAQYRDDVIQAMGKKEGEKFLKDFSSKQQYVLGGMTRFRESKLTHEELVCLALNLGTEIGHKRVLDIYEMNEGKLRDLLYNLSGADWNLIQNIWNLHEEYWPELQKVTANVTGVTMEKQQAREFTVMSKDGVTYPIKGGYYHLAYDPTKNLKINEQKADERLTTQSGSNRRFGIGIGMTKERNQYEVKYALKLDLGVMQRALAETVHYISFYETVKDVNRLINTYEFADTVVGYFGEEHYQVLQKWVKDAWALEPESKTAMEQMNASMRANQTMATLGFSMITAAENILNIAPMMAEIGPLNAVKAVASYYGQMFRTGLTNPMEMFDQNAFIAEHSIFMAERGESIDPNIHKAQTDNGMDADNIITKGFKKTQDAAFYFITQTDLMLGRPLWMHEYQRVYNECIMDNMSPEVAERKAVQAGDAAVRHVFGSAADVDKAEVQRSSSELMKFATMFYSYFSTVHNAMISKGYEYQEQRHKGAGVFKAAAPTLVWGAMMWYLLPSIGSAVMRAYFKGSDDDREPDALAKKIASTLAGNIFGGLPFLRDAVPAALDMAMGERTYGFRNAPMYEAGKQAMTTVSTIIKAAQGDKDAFDVMRSLGRVMVYMSRFPLTATNAMITAAQWINEGDLSDDEMAEYMRAMLMNQKPKK